MNNELIEIDVAQIEHSPLINEDIAPTTISQRTWGTYNIAALWIGMSVCIPTYMLASGLIAGGMNWWQAIFTIALGNIIVLIPMILNAHAGTKYGIPFPVLARSSFGTIGSNVPALLRAIVACGWFGIQTWIGGQAIDAMLKLLIPVWSVLAYGPWISFAIFWSINVYFIVKGTESIRWLESYTAPFLIVVGLGLLGWAYREGGGWGPILSQESKFKTATEFWNFFIPSLTGMVGFWATLSLNIPDFSRYAKSQRAQILGQALGLPPTMALYAFIGVAVTSATIVIFGTPIWDPVELLTKFRNPIVIFLSLVSLLVATLTTNIAANVVSPANDFANMLPKKISFKTGGFITAFVGIAIMPWKLLSDFGTYIFGWLIGYSGFLGPIAGIMIADYFFIHKQNLNLKDLYLHNGEYEFTSGINWKAILSLVAGIVVALIGVFVSELRFLYDYAWFVGFGVAAICYMVVMRK
jgi:NCS1 family nucleobase:cation symporter-1